MVVAFLCSLGVGLAPRSTLSAPLVDGLGGEEGFGDPVFFEPPFAFDLTEAGDEGLNFYGQRHTELFISEYGMLLFGAFSNWSPEWAIPAFERELVLAPRIAAYQLLSGLSSFPSDHPDPFMFAAARDVPGGRQFIATWYRIPNRGPGSVGQPRYNSWQAIITALEPDGDAIAAGDFDVELRFSQCDWLDRPNQSTRFRPLIGFDSAEGEGGQHWLMAESNSAVMEHVCELSNVREPGVFRYQFRDGLPQGCGNGLPVPAGDDRCVDADNNLPGDGCSAACFVEPDVDGDSRYEAPHPDAVDPFETYDECIDPEVLECNDDVDGDQIPRHLDNCPNVPNPDQHNYDGDGAGDVCDSDADGDGLLWPFDPVEDPPEHPDGCPYVFSRGERVVIEGIAPIAQWTDQDRDGLGDQCDPDDDNDGVADCGGDGLCSEIDNGYNDDRDDAIDEAGECDAEDEDYDDCLFGDRDLFDNDADGWVDERDEEDLERAWWPGPDLPPAMPEDNCRLIANPSQSDLDGDLIGDACDPDPDGDAVPSCVGGALCGPLRDARDNDADGRIDEAAECESGCDPYTDLIDQDRDGYVDEVLEADNVVNQPLPLDNCPFLANPDQLDSNADGRGDLCADDDDDGIRGIDDNCIGVANPDQFDLDDDGLGDACDPDDDDDGVPDAVDVCPRVADDQTDLDGDMIGDACDPDDDEDGVNDTFDGCPRHYDPGQADLDGDGLGDVCDDDDDGDGTPDAQDGCPRLADDQVDLDGDGQGNACDPDDDGDGVNDDVDLCPFVADDQSDLDEDGLGDACDPTDDRPFDRRTPEEQCAILLAEGGSTAHRLAVCPGPVIDSCAVEPGRDAPPAGWLLALLAVGLRRATRR